QLQIVQTAVSDINRNMSSVKVKAATFDVSTKGLNKYEIAIHHKFALAISCIVLFFVGAPLGAIIRKGGMGLPLVFAIILFLSYHFIGMMASNAAEENKLPVWLGAWLSTLVMLPLGISFTLRATADKGVFNPNEFIERLKSWFKFIPILFSKKASKS
ncbi:MAG: LptF/LptG family permease, partial [Flavobacteriaceae bacterium]|nr:LptF/LptG family permease [Flavobacteriaceae bacterium]